MTNREAIEILKIERNHMIPTLLPERIEAIDMAISALEKQIPKKVKWIPQDHNKTNGMASTLVFYYPKCSECGHSGNYDMNFCPNCGADMREEK